MATAAGATVSGTLSANGSGTQFQPIPRQPFNFWITGTFTATATLERSSDGGSTWSTVPKPDLTAATFTAPQNGAIYEPTADTLYRVTVSGYGSGAVAYKFSQ